MLVGTVPDTYRAYLTPIVTETPAAGVIPVLSIRPPCLDPATPDANTRVAALNQVVADVVQAKQIPLWNYWAALATPGLVNHGLDSDGIHPNVYPGADGGSASADFSPDGLRYGDNLRNLTALQVLAEIKTAIIDPGILAQRLNQRMRV